MKAVQKFSDEYLKECRSMTPDQIAEFLENFRLLHGNVTVSGKSKLISIKIRETLLNTFKMASKQDNIPYQTKIKQLMIEWLKKK